MAKEAPISMQSTTPHCLVHNPIVSGSKYIIFSKA